MRFERRGGSGGFGGGRRFGGGGRGFDRGNDQPKPVKVGEEYDVDISEVGSKGDGIARVKNFVVFVNGVKQGEKARIKITDVRNRFAIGEKVGGAGEATEGAAETTEEPAAEGEAAPEAPAEEIPQETEETTEE